MPECLSKSDDMHYGYDWCEHEQSSRQYNMSKPSTRALASEDARIAVPVDHVAAENDSSEPQKYQIKPKGHRNQECRIKKEYKRRDS
jgi:hypothetical protein